MRPSRQNRLRCRLRSQGGYVAVYVIAIVLLMTGVVLEGSRLTREQAGLARQSAERLAAGTRTQAAQALLKARLETHWTQNYLAHPNLFELATLQDAVIPIDTARIEVIAEDAELRPDANLLSAIEWQRLLLAYGLAADAASEVAQRLLLLKAGLKDGKFSRLNELVDFPYLPASAVNGSPGLPPWRDLLALGHGSKRLHLRDAPLPLFQAILGASPEQIERWRDIRASRVPQLADAELIFGAEARSLCYAGDPQQLKLLRLRLIAGIPDTERDILVQIGANNRLIITLL